MNTPKHRTIYNYINELIASGKYSVGDQLPTDGQLIYKFKVSRGTVGKAMRDLENAGIVVRRAGSGTFVRQIPSDKNAFVAVLIAGLGDTEFYEPICARIAQSCHKHNLSLIWGTLHNGERRSLRDAVDHFCGLMNDRSVSGVFFAPDEIAPDADQDINGYLLESLSRSGIQVVLIDRSECPFPQNSRYDFVGIDNFHAGYMQTQHLIECGCQKILYVARPGFLSTKEARIAGYRYAMKRACMDIPDSWYMEGDIDSKGFFNKILKEKPDGIVCFHDPIAIALIQSLSAKKIRIPQTVKIIGVDDVHYSRYLQIPLTTIRQPCQHIADTAVTMMLERLANPDLPSRDLRLATKLIVRQSTVQ